MYLFDGCLLGRYSFVFKNVDGLLDVLLQTVFGLLEAIPGQSLGFGVSFCVGLRRRQGQSWRCNTQVR